MAERSSGQRNGMEYIIYRGKGQKDWLKGPVVQSWVVAKVHDFGVRARLRTHIDPAMKKNEAGVTSSIATITALTLTILHTTVQLLKNNFSC